jgi:Bacterial membrane protein YfhO
MPDERQAHPARRWSSLVAVVAATAPFVAGLSSTRIFYIRDLSMFFWGRHLWLRHALRSGQFPLWDPYVAAGQSAIADALRQMMLPPALALRVIGSDVFSFNLWVAAPFPIAALGAWCFLRRRFSSDASALGAIAFAVSGPVVSTANFPNMSWSVGAIPWLLWAADRLALGPTPAAVAVLGIVTALQALAGEPVTLLATLALVVAFVAIVDPPHTGATMRRRGRALLAAVAGIGVGLALAAMQLLPLARAASGSERAAAAASDFWSLHPVALLETVSLHLFGDYFVAQSLKDMPWLALVNSGREPFLFSLYFGVPLLTLALFGLIAHRQARFSLFWIAVGVASLIGAFGAHTPVYPFLQRHLPLLSSFRFPAKYMVFSSLVVAVGAAAGWDTIAPRRPAGGGARFRMAQLGSVWTAMAFAAIACGVAGACMYAPNPTAVRLYTSARSLGAPDPVAAAAFMFQTLPRQASVILLLSAAAGCLVWLASSQAAAPASRWVLAALIVGDLIVRASAINPVFDPAYLMEPAWLSYTRAHPDARIYVGSKREGTLDTTDLDSSGPIRNPPGLAGSASRAAVSGQLNFEASAFQVREMLSYDLPVLWPREFGTVSQRFIDADRAQRDMMLDRTGVRYRILPQRQAGAHRPLIQVPYFFESFLFDWGSGVSSRVFVVPDARVVADTNRQVSMLFEGGWDAKVTALVEREPAAAGIAGSASTQPTAAIVADGANRVVVEAAAGATGGYLVMLDTYTDDWRVRVDGQPASMVRANGLFRAVRLVTGPHVIEFVYRPRALLVGLGVSVAALLLLIALMGWPAAALLSGRRSASDMS